jgi:hypothetical protein
MEKLYRVHFFSPIPFIDVEAENEEEAWERADYEYDQLIAVNDTSVIETRVEELKGNA